MSVLDRLKEKVQEWKARIVELEEENARLREQLEAMSAGGEEVDALQAKLREYEATIETLRIENAEKDEQIEETIAKVEALLA